MLGDLSRINANVQSLQSLGALNKTNDDLAMRQMRLATGNRINRAEDDSAGYSIAKKLGARVRGQAQAMSNVSDAKNMLTVAEGSLGSVMDILQTMKEKTVQAANDTLGADERAAIQGQLDALRSEVTDILGGTTFNGTALFSDAGDSFNFQVNAESGDSFAVDIDGISADSLLGTVTTTAASGASSNLTGITSGEITGIAFDGAADTSYSFQIVDADGTNSKLQVDKGDGNGFTDVAGGTFAVATGNALAADATFSVDDFDFTIATGYTVTNSESFDLDGTAAVTSGGLVVDSHANATASIATVDAAIKGVSDMVSSLGDSQSRLSFKANNLQTSMTNNEAARSQIEDADFAKEQMEIVKLQILQQTGIASLAQANSAPQGVLQLLR